MLWTSFHDSLFPNQLTIRCVVAMYLPLALNLGGCRQSAHTHTLRHAHPACKIFGSHFFVGNRSRYKQQLFPNDRLRPTRTGYYHLPCQVFFCGPFHRDVLISDDSAATSPPKLRKICGCRRNKDSKEHASQCNFWKKPTKHWDHLNVKE